MFTRRLLSIFYWPLVPINPACVWIFALCCADLYSQRSHRFHKLSLRHFCLNFNIYGFLKGKFSVEMTSVSQVTRSDPDAAARDVHYWSSASLQSAVWSLPGKLVSVCFGNDSPLSQQGFYFVRIKAYLSFAPLILLHDFFFLRISPDLLVTSFSVPFCNLTGELVE